MVIPDKPSVGIWTMSCMTSSSPGGFAWNGIVRIQELTLVRACLLAVIWSAAARDDLRNASVEGGQKQIV